MSTPDQETEASEFDESIAPNVLKSLAASLFFEQLEARVFIEGVSTCNHSFDQSKDLLKDLGYSEEDQQDIYDVLASRGGCCCDCEILYNAVPDGCAASRTYWKAQAAKIGETPK